jgi:hypothetical protein
MSKNDILSYETMRYVALEIVQLGRDIPEDQWFEDAEHYATSLIRRIAEVAYDEGQEAACRTRQPSERASPPTESRLWFGRRLPPP